MSLATILVIFLASFNFTDNPDVLSPETFVVYLSSSTTAEDLKGLEEDLIRHGVGIDFSSSTFDDDGFLEFTKVLLHAACAEEPYDIEHALSLTTQEPVGVIFIGDDCQAGVFSTSEKQKDSLLSMFFRSSKPQRIIKGWK